MTLYSPVVKAESFVCTKNSTSGHVVARLRVRTEREKWYSCEMEPEDYQSEIELGQYHPLQLRSTSLSKQSSTVSPHLRLSGSGSNAERIALCR